MDQKDLTEVERLHEEIEVLKGELTRKAGELTDRDEQIRALKGFMRLKHVDPDFLAA